MSYDVPIKIPSAKGKIIIKKKGDASYVLFQYGQVYKPEKQYVIPQRVVIGKVNPDDSETMFPNEKFETYFPETVLPEVRSEAYRSCALRIGSYVVIKKVFDEYALPSLLKKHFGDETGLLMDLVSYLIIDEDNAAQYYPDFAYNHPLFSEQMKIYSDSKVCRFFKSIKKDQILGFLNEWNKKRDHRQRIYVSYDSTNKYCQAGDIDFIECGKAKDGGSEPIFNLSIAFDKTNRVPLFYETYGGSLNDVAQFTYMVDKVKDYGYRNIGFILDRGYFSKTNIRYLEENGYSFIIMAKGCKQLVSDLVMQNRNTFETNRANAIRSYRVYGKTIKARLYEDDTRNRFFHLYFNTSKQAAERENLERDLDKMKMFLDKHIGMAATFTGIYNEYFTLQYNKKGILTGYAEKEDVIQQKLDLCGYFCIITSEEMSASEALIHYKGRDISEKLFRTDKTFIGSRSMRVQSAESLEAKLFVEFIALIVRNRIYNLLKELMLRMEARPKYLTVPAGIHELEKIEMVKRNNGQYRLDHAVSKKQKTILSAFGLDEDSIRTAATEIGRMLEKNKSMIDLDSDDDEEEDDYGEDADYSFD